KTILAFDEIARDAAHKLSPAVIANYVYDLAKSFNQFYHDNVIVDVEQPLTSKFRLHLCHKTAAVIALALSLLGIHAPEQM
ncbi:MAG: DALR anticodon-binding domain-containing protein, partial [Bacteroidota bacterium]